LEVHAPVNGSEATGKAPDTAFTFTIAHEKSAPQIAATYFKVDEPKLERWNFTWFEGMTTLHVVGEQLLTRPRSLRQRRKEAFIGECHLESLPKSFFEGPRLVHCEFSLLVSALCSVVLSTYSVASLHLSLLSLCSIHCKICNM
jgi:hypothetical protein